MSIPCAPKVPDHPRPSRGRAASEGTGEGGASVVFGALVLPSMLLTIVPSMLAMLFTRPDTGSNGLEWVAAAVFWSLPTFFGLLAALFGILAVRRHQRDTSAWSAGVAGLWLVGTQAAFVLLPGAIHVVVTALP
ncbi:hypothetical protein [Arthrobacter sp. NPDC093139]|uniref:hypothetical protein n=1 Tax=Arthrobacter sp. NPDC093139 TaxID=3363945 RepID=UPI0038173140